MPHVCSRYAGTFRGQKWEQGPLVMELQIPVHGLIWVLGLKHQVSDRAPFKHLSRARLLVVVDGEKTRGRALATFDSQNPHGSSQPSVTLVPRGLTFSSGFLGQWIEVVHRQTCLQNTHMYKNKEIILQIISSFGNRAMWKMWSWKDGWRGWRGLVHMPEADSQSPGCQRRTDAQKLSSDPHDMLSCPHSYTFPPSSSPSPSFTHTLIIIVIIIISF